MNEFVNAMTGVTALMSVLTVKAEAIWAGLGRLATCLLRNRALPKCSCALISVNFCWLKQLAKHQTCFSRLQFWCISTAQGLVFLLWNGKVSAGKLNTRAERLIKIALKCRNQCSWKLIARPPWYQLGSALLEQTWGILHLGEGTLDKGLEGTKWLCFMSWMWDTRLGKGCVQAPLSKYSLQHCALTVIYSYWQKKKGKGLKAKEKDKNTFLAEAVCELAFRMGSTQHANYFQDALRRKIMAFLLGKKMLF